MDVDHYVESLELEVIRLRAGWSDAEAQIAVLRDQKETLALELGRLLAEVETWKAVAEKLQVENS